LPIGRIAAWQPALGDVRRIFRTFVFDKNTKTAYSIGIIPYAGNVSSRDTYGPLHPKQKNMNTAHSNHPLQTNLQTVHKPFHKPLTNRLQTVYKPFTNRLQTVYQPTQTYTNHTNQLTYEN
jgi:hypothetical protein